MPLWNYKWGEEAHQTHRETTITVNNFNKYHEEKGAVRKRTVGRVVVVGGRGRER